MLMKSEFPNMIRRFLQNCQILSSVSKINASNLTKNYQEDFGLKILQAGYYVCNAYFMLANVYKLVDFVH